MGSKNLHILYHGTKGRLKELKSLQVQHHGIERRLKEPENLLVLYLGCGGKDKVAGHERRDGYSGGGSPQSPPPPPDDDYDYDLPV